MGKMSKSVKVGLFSILSIFILYYGISFLKGINLMSKGNTFYAYYDEIGGLDEGNTIMIKGYQVGLVRQIEFDQNSEKKLKVMISLDKQINIPINTVARIVNQDLMGSKGITLVLGNAEEMAVSGSELIGEIEGSLQQEVNAQILPLKNKAEELISSIDSVMVVITSVLNKDARASLTKSLISLDNTFNTLSSTMLTVNNIVKNNEQNLNEIVSNFKTISSSFSESNTEIKNILSNFSSLSDSLAKADILSTLNNIDNITKQINNKEGSLGLLINDKALYNNLQKASKELEQLLGDLKNNPGKYVQFSVFGGKDKD